MAAPTIAFNPVVPAVLGGVTGLIVGGINRGNDGPTGLQESEVDESLRRTAYTAAAFAPVGLVLGFGARQPVVGAIVGAVGGAILGASYQFTKNALD